MSESDLPYALHGFLLVGAFLVWFYVGWQDHVVESGRDALWKLRNEWFDLVVSNAAWRDDSACHALLSVLNAQVQWIQYCSFPIFALALCRPRARRSGATRFIEKTIRELPGVELRWKARRLLDDAALVIGRTMIMRSLPALLLVLLLLPLLLIGAVICVSVSRLLASTASVPAAMLRQGWVGGLRDATSRTLRPVLEMELNSSVGGSVAAVWRGERRRST